MTLYRINKKRLRQTLGKLCSCLIPSKENNKPENFCPCTEFIEQDRCRCKLFTPIHEITDKCIKCNAPLIKESEYTWKHTCECFKPTMRIHKG